MTSKWVKIVKITNITKYMNDMYLWTIVTFDFIILENIYKDVNILQVTARYYFLLCIKNWVVTWKCSSLFEMLCFAVEKKFNHRLNISLHFYGKYFMYHFVNFWICKFMFVHVSSYVFFHYKYFVQQTFYLK